MIYELRTYVPAPGRLDDVLAPFRQPVLQIWEEPGIELFAGQVGDATRVSLAVKFRCRAMQYVDALKAVPVEAGDSVAEAGVTMPPALRVGSWVLARAHSARGVSLTRCESCRCREFLDQTWPLSGKGRIRLVILHKEKIRS